MRFLKKYKKFVFISIIILCVFMAILSINRSNPTFFEDKLGFLITPIQKINTQLYSWIKGKYDLYLKFEELETENKELKMELETKEQQLSRLKLLEKENEKLQELLNMSSRYQEYEKVTANVIAKDPGNWYSTFIIDKGSKDGLKKNMVIISSKGLVGIIKECGYNYSKVTSIIDDVDSVSAKTLRTDDIGFIHGDLSNKNFLKMEYIDKDAQIVEGDEIITSHLSETFPPGIPIGYVTEISLDENNLSKTAVVKPFVDFKHLEHVLVITTDFSSQYNDNFDEEG